MAQFKILSAWMLVLAARVWSAAAQDSDSISQRIAAAKPGDEIRLASGPHRGGILVRGLVGTPEKPIVITSADPSKPARIVGGASGLHLASCAYVEIKDLIIERAEANGVNIDDGGATGRPSHHITLANLQIRDIGSRGNHDGIKLSGVNDFRVAHCTVERWGEGGSGIDMVGCHRGVISGSTFRHVSDTIAANGVQAKGGSAGVSIEGCLFDHAGGRAVNLGGSTGAHYFRPREAKFEASELRVVECTISGSMAAVAFVGVDGAVVERNRIYRPRRWCFRILQENRDPRLGQCRAGRVADNTIVFRSDEVTTAVNVGDMTKPESFVFIGNSWFCADQPARSRPTLPVEEYGGLYGEDPGWPDPEAGEFETKLK